MHQTSARALLIFEALKGGSYSWGRLYHYFDLTSDSQVQSIRLPVHITVLNHFSSLKQRLYDNLTEYCLQLNAFYFVGLNFLDKILEEHVISSSTHYKDLKIVKGLDLDDTAFIKR